MHTSCTGCQNGTVLIIFYILTKVHVTEWRENTQQTKLRVRRVYVTAPLNPEDDIAPRRRLHISISCCFSFIKRVRQSTACFSLARRTGRLCTYLNLSSEMTPEESRCLGSSFSPWSCGKEEEKEYGKRCVEIWESMRTYQRWGCLRLDAGLHRQSLDVLPHLRHRDLELCTTLLQTADLLWIFRWSHALQIEIQPSREHSDSRKKRGWKWKHICLKCGGIRLLRRKMGYWNTMPIAMLLLQ